MEQAHCVVKRRMNPELGCGSFRTAQRSLQGDEARQLRQKDHTEGLAKGAVRARNCVMAQLFGGTAYERCFEGQTGSVTFVQQNRSISLEPLFMPTPVRAARDRCSPSGSHAAARC